MTIEERQKPREGSAFATYAHQRPPKSSFRFLRWIGLVGLGILGLSWLV